MKKERERKSVDFAKIPPQAVDMEEDVLSICIQRPNELSQVGHILDAKIFYKQAHQLIAQAIIDLYKANNPVDLTTVVQELKKTNNLDNVGGVYALTTLGNNTSLSFNTVQYKVRILFQYYFAREGVKIMSEYLNTFYDFPQEDIFVTIDNLKKDIAKYIDGSLEEPGENITITMESAFDRIMSIAEGNIKNYFPTGSDMFDKKLGMGPGLLLIAAYSGIGKTSFLTHIMLSLLSNNDNISVKWHCIDHDTSTTMIRKFLSRMLYLTDKEITGQGYKLSKSDIVRIEKAKQILTKYDIEFVDKPSTIRSIGNGFVQFCKTRSQKDLNVLVIDNVMRLKDHGQNKRQNEIDDEIANTIADIRKETLEYNSLIIYLHHITKDVIDNDNLKIAYKPSSKSVKGSSRYGDVAEKILLLNRPGNFPDLVSEYIERKDIIEKMFIVEITKNSLGELGLLYYLNDPRFNYYAELIKS